MPDTARFTIVFANALGAAAVAHLGTELQVLPVVTDAAEDPVSIADALAIGIQFAGGLVGEIYVCPDQDASRSLFPTLDHTSGGDLSSAWLRLLQASGNGIAEGLRDHFGDLRLENYRVETMSARLISVGTLRLNGGDTCQGTISLLADAALLRSLERSGTDSGGQVHGLSDSDSEVEAAASFERVIDVPLGVTLRFGQRQLSVRELLELNMGSLLELDRQVDEPVDLMLGDRLIARGEVVIVDGNYGMRVTEVIEQPARRGVDHSPVSR